MEKVVERIRQQRCKGCLFLRSLAEDKCGGNIGRCREEIRWGIAYTLGAVWAGDLDEELGVLDRWKGGKLMARPYFGLSWAKEGIELIALPAPPRTGEQTIGPTGIASKEKM